MTTRELTLQYLRTLQEQGINQLPLNDEGRSVLRAWMLAAREKKNNPAAFAAIPAAEAEQERNETPTSEDEIRFILPDAKDEEKPETPEELLMACFSVPDGPPSERWLAFEYLLKHWEPVRKLGTLRSTLVLGEGNKQADIMFIGDAPNATDEKTGKPFSAEAGGKLNDMLKAMALTRDDVYITHLVKYRPSMPRQLTNNRPPSAIEIELFSQVLRSEIELVKPRVIVALGVIAARGLLELGELPLAEYQSEARKLNDIPVLVTHHPSYLLRTTDRAERRILWETMLECLSLAGHQITEKQQGYFLPRA